MDRCSSSKRSCYRSMLCRKLGLEKQMKVSGYSFYIHAAANVHHHPSSVSYIIYMSLSDEKISIYSTSLLWATWSFMAYLGVPSSYIFLARIAFSPTKSRKYCTTLVVRYSHSHFVCFFTRASNIACCLLACLIRVIWIRNQSNN